MSLDKVKLGSINEVRENSVKVFECKGKHILVCNWQGRFYALDDRCTHDNGPLAEGELIDGEIECPRHGARFCLETGKAMCLPAVGAVSTYVLEIHDGEIYIGL